MAKSPRRVWRAAPATLAVVGLFCLAAGICVPVLAYLVLLREQSPGVPGLLDDPGRRRADLRVALRPAPEPAGRPGRRHGPQPRSARPVRLVGDHRAWPRARTVWSIGSEQDAAEAWCVQKSRWATRRGRRTRADRIVEQLCDLQDSYDPPLEDEETGIRIRRARWHEHGLLTRLERSASKAALGHVFPADDYPYPTAAVRRRWRRRLRDRMMHVRILDLFETPIGLVAYESAGTLRHLAIVPQQARRGYGSLLLEYAIEEIFDSGAESAASCGSWSRTRPPARSTAVGASTPPTSGETRSTRRTRAS